MNIAEQIKHNITEAIELTHLEVINQSHLHKGHAGDDGSGESHFKLVVVWAGFSAYSRIERQRHVHKALGQDLIQKIHALQLSCLTPDKFQS